MLDKIPTEQEIQQLLGKVCYQTWLNVIDFINQHYLMDTLWNKGGKAAKYELKFRRSSKTLCALYPRENNFGFMVIFGKAERGKFEQTRSEFSLKIQQQYDEATTYHDGKWLMIEITDMSHFKDIQKLLAIKRKPNNKK